MPIPILSVTGRAQELIFVTHSQTMPMLLVQEPCFEKQGPTLASHGPAMSMPLAVRHLLRVTDGSESRVEAKDSTTQKNAWVHL